MNSTKQPIREYHSNGFLKRIYFTDENGVKNGLYKEYYSDGSLMLLCFYEKNIKLEPFLITKSSNERRYT